MAITIGMELTVFLLVSDVHSIWYGRTICVFPTVTNVQLDHTSMVTNVFDTLTVMTIRSGIRFLLSVSVLLAQFGMECSALTVVME